MTARLEGFRESFIFEQSHELRGRHRPAEIVSLRLVTLVGPQKTEFLLRFHALGNDPQLQASAHADHRGDDVVSSAAVVIWRTNDWSILRASMGNFRR